MYQKGWHLFLNENIEVFTGCKQYFVYLTYIYSFQIYLVQGWQSCANSSIES